MRETRRLQGLPGQAWADSCSAVFTLVPLYVMVTSSLKPLADVQGEFTWWPTHLTIAAVHRHVEDRPAGAVLREQPDRVRRRRPCLSVVIAIFAAYAVSRYRFRGRASSR